jgi:hypothetical protein
VFTDQAEEEQLAAAGLPTSFASNKVGPPPLRAAAGAACWSWRCRWR